MTLQTLQIDVPDQYRHRVQLATTVNELIKVSPPYDRTEAERTAGVTPADTRYPELDVRRYGAVGDDSTDCLEAFNNAYLVAVAKAANDHGAEIFVPEGKFRLSDEWDVYRANSPRLDITVRGVDQLNSILVANFYGAGLALIRCIDPLGSTRASPLSIRDLGFENVSTSGGVNPVFISVLGHGESRVDRVRFGSSNNTHMRLISAQNVRGTDVVSFFGGRHFNYKNTSGFTFSVDTTANTITANAAIFDAGDVGKLFFLFPSDATRRIVYTISGFTSSTVVSYTGASELTETTQAGHFEPARCSMTSGDATLTANAACFTADMVGLVVYVRGARAGSYGNALLRGTITAFNSTSSVELDVTAGVTVTDAYFAVATIDMGLPSGWSGSSDVQIDKLHVEHYDGVGFVAQNTDTYHISGKIHGETTVTDSAKSMAATWLDDFGGKFELWMDSSCSMSDCRVHVSNFNDMTMFDAAWTRGIINGVVFKSDLFTSADGYCIIRGLNSYIDVSDAYSFVSDANHTADATDPRLLYFGVVDMVGDSQKARAYLNRNLYVLPDGRMVYGATTVGASYDMALSGSSGVRVLFEDIATKRWSIGNTPGGGSNFVFRDESAAADRWGLSGTSGALIPLGTSNTLDIGSTSARVANAYATQLRPGAGTPIWTSGSGTPESAVTAPVGSLFTRTDGGASTTLYVKESGSGNTGWVAK